MQNLEDLRRKEEESKQLDQELNDTNRGVVALYAELDERAEQLRRASELKTNFLSNMSHEFRTPLNSVLALSRLLLDRVDGVLTRSRNGRSDTSAARPRACLELVNDLLDLAKVEAGKVDVRPTAFTVGELFSSLRGALRPLATDPAVDMIFEIPDKVPRLFTDEAKVTAEFCATSFPTR